MATSRSPRVLYLHGLESGPGSTKVSALRAGGLEVHAPQLDTGPAQEVVRDPRRTRTGAMDALVRPLEQARAAIAAHEPEVIVGSSFGGALLLQLLLEPSPPQVPVVMLAGAGVLWLGVDRLPGEQPAVLLHGRQDEVVPVEHSRLLAASSPRATLIEVHDDHRLSRSTSNGLLVTLVSFAASLGSVKS